MADNLASPPGNNHPAAANAEIPVAKRAGESIPVLEEEPEPPEERFWIRYSKHYELPLSSTSSFVLHVFVIGLLLMAGILLRWFGWSRADRTLAIEPVHFAGGGGRKGGKDLGPGVGNVDAGGLQEEAKEGQEGNQTTPPVEIAQRPDLKPSEKEELSRVFDNDPSAVRLINSGNENMKAFKALGAEVQKKLRSGLNPGRGRGGSGEGGGKDTGRGTGEGAGTGEGRASLTQREKRMLRWSMSFDTRNGEDYLQQLKALGAILAIPTVEDERQYQVIRDLSKKPPKLLNEDLSQIQRIYWVDDKPQSVRALMGALGLTRTPSHFVAFMPKELEDRLFEMELKYFGRKEDQILETKFRVVHTARGYEPEVVGQTPK